MQADLARVRLVWAERQVTARFNLGGSGENFLHDLSEALRPLSVNRQVHHVRFSTEKGDSVTDSCEVSLLLDEVGYDWEDAVDWIRAKRETAPRGLYAIIEQRDVR